MERLNPNLLHNCAMRVAFVFYVNAIWIEVAIRVEMAGFINA